MNENFTDAERIRVKNVITQIRNNAIRSYLIFNAAVEPLIYDKPIPTLPDDLGPITISQILSPHPEDESIFRLQLAQEYQLSLIEDINMSVREYSEKVISKINAFFVNMDQVSVSIRSCEDCDEEKVAKMYFSFYKQSIAYMEGLIEAGTYLTTIQPKLQQAIMNYETSKTITEEQIMDSRGRAAISVYRFFNMKVNTSDGEMRTIDILHKAKEYIEDQISKVMVSTLQSKITAYTCREKGKQIAEIIDQYDSDSSDSSGMRGGMDKTDTELSSFNNILNGFEGDDEMSIISEQEEPEEHNDDNLEQVAWEQAANNLGLALDNSMESVAEGNIDMSFSDEPLTLADLQPPLTLADLQPPLTLADLEQTPLTLADLEQTPPPLTVEDLAVPSFDEGHTTRDTSSFMTEQSSFPSVGTSTLAWMSPDNSTVN